jgi:hypothetical protein
MQEIERAGLGQRAAVGDAKRLIVGADRDQHLARLDGRWIDLQRAVRHAHELDVAPPVRLGAHT